MVQVLVPLVVAAILWIARKPGARLVRWLWRRNVSEPLTGWLKGHTADVVTDLIGNPNGKGKLYPMVSEVIERLDEHERLHAVDSFVTRQ